MLELFATLYFISKMIPLVLIGSWFLYLITVIAWDRISYRIRRNKHGRS